MSKTNCISSILHSCGMKNVVTSPTCFKSKTPTSIDVVFTNVPKRIQNVTCIDVALSDFHHMVCWATKQHIVKKPERWIKYRSYKRFNENDYINDVATAPFHVSEVFDDVNDSYWFCQQLVKDVIDRHAPLKSRKIKTKDVPYMNDELKAMSGNEISAI